VLHIACCRASNPADVAGADRITGAYFPMHLQKDFVKGASGVHPDP